jgi:hypothetical protein
MIGAICLLNVTAGRFAAPSGAIASARGAKAASAESSDLRAAILL